MKQSIRLSLACLALPFAFALSSCGDGLDTPTANATPTPTPRPSATPTPTATPTPAATPTPSGSATCALPARPDCGNSGCCSEGGTPLFNAQINDAQAQLERTRPDIFNSNGSLRLDELEYTDLLAKTIMQLFPGVCARGGGRDGESYSKDEVVIKSDNTVSQNVDVIIGSSHEPYIGGRYTCRPASF
ncbi:MAG: hypothetical protein ABIR28_03505 [Vicinamibacteria bacterium]